MPGRGLIIAAAASSSGKTLLTAGLVRHLRRRGLAVAAAKAGPDYIDPTFHRAAGASLCHNLDCWAMRPETLRGLVGELERAAELVLCEGVMGLFDGTGPDGESGSTAELAMRTGWPVVLLVDVRGQGASIAALLRGFAGHQPRLPLAGVIFNRVAGARHRELLRAAVARHLPELAVFGDLPAVPGLALPSRHLGLVPADENRETERILEEAAARVAAGIEVDRLLAAARPSICGSGRLSAPLPPLGRHIAVARDDAFGFDYPSVLAGWRRGGAAITFFSPLAGEPPDPAADAVYLPGGYPQLGAARLAAAEEFLTGLRRAAAAGRPIYGECGGYMVLGESLVDADGQAHAMAGLLPLVTSFSERRLSLGYREARLLAGAPLGGAGQPFRGHEFHYARIVAEGPGEPLFAVADAAGTELGLYGLRRGSAMGSFVHLIDAAPPPVRSCREPRPAAPRRR